MAAAKPKQIGVLLSDDTRKRLETAAAAGGHSIAEEIRQRLERTFEEESLDPKMRKLMNAIKEMVELGYSISLTKPNR